MCVKARLSCFTAHAEVIVSGDNHLLELLSWRGIAVLAHADFLKRGL